MPIEWNSGLPATPVSGVTSFNTRTGAVVLLGSDVTTALGFTPENVANKATDFTTVNNVLYPTIQAVVNYVSALPPGGVSSFNTRTGAVVLLSADITTALGFTPANNALVVHLSGTETITGHKTFSLLTSFIRNISGNYCVEIKNASAIGMGLDIAAGGSSTTNPAVTITDYSGADIADFFNDQVAFYNSLFLIRSDGTIKAVVPAYASGTAVNVVYNSTTNRFETLAGGGSGVTSFNTRTGVVVLLSADVTGALGYTPERVLTFNNGLTRTANTIALGGTLLAATIVDMNGRGMSFSATASNSFFLARVLIGGITSEIIVSEGTVTLGVINSDNCLINIDNVGGMLVDDALFSVGLVGAFDYSANIDPLAYAQQSYVDNKLTGGSFPLIQRSGILAHGTTTSQTVCPNLVVATINMFRVNSWINVASATVGTVGMVVDFTDDLGNAQSVAIYGGLSVPGYTAGQSVTINAVGTIIIRTVVTGTINYSAGAVLEQLTF